MEPSNFNNLLKNKTEIQQVETADLKAVINKYPYFQAARALYLKGLQNQDSFKYNKELKITAAYTTDRAVLFNFITSEDFKSREEETPNTIVEEVSIDEAFIAIDEDLIDEENPIVVEKEESVEEATKELKIGTPISFSDSESYSFNQWLQLSTKKPIVREPETSIEKITEKNTEKKFSEKEDIIEKFIQSNPKISPLPKDKKVAISVAQNKQDAALMTETLAKVYLEQKKYENAMQAYRILILKYPEKSGFFADQIKRIQILQKQK